MRKTKYGGGDDDDDGNDAECPIRVPILTMMQSHCYNLMSQNGGRPRLDTHMVPWH